MCLAPGVVRIGNPLPGATAVLAQQGTGFAVFHQAIQHGGDRGERVLVARKQGWNLLLNEFTNFASAQGTVTQTCDGGTCTTTGNGTATVKTTGQTGVEMEALTAVAVAALTIYDMCKAVDKTMRIGNIRLVSKTKAAA